MEQLEFNFEEIRVKNLSDLSAFTKSDQRIRLCIQDLLNLAEECYIRNEHQTVTGIVHADILGDIQELLVGRMVNSVSENLRKRYLLLLAYIAQFRAPLKRPS